MRRTMIVFILLICVFCLIGCEDIPSEAGMSYEIITIEDIETYAGKVCFPQFASAFADYSSMNKLLEKFVYEYLNQLLEEAELNSTIQIDYEITLSSNELLCILFEGELSSEFSAHPTNFSFSICFSPENNVAIDPKTLFEPTTQWLSSFREQLKTNQAPTRFSDEDWEIVSTYINGFPDEEILELLYSDLSKTVVFCENGIIVLFPVPHALGDYIKIFVPND